MTSIDCDNARTTPGEGDLLTRAEASAFLREFGIRMKPATLARAWSVGSNGPPCRHIRGKPLYPRSVLRAWAEQQTTGLRRSARDATDPEADRGRT
jgi:hypothetical protein